MSTEKGSKRRSVIVSGGIAQKKNKNIMMSIYDLVIEIISRLPAKSLRRFQCVSKEWSSLISQVVSKRILPMSGFFIRTSGGGCFASVASDPLQWEEEGRVFASSLSSLPFRFSFNVIHACNGLFLFAHKHPTVPALYYVWNPATMERVALPERPNLCQYCFLAFEPRKSPHYKVVRLSSGSKCNHIIVEIYSSITSSWEDPFTAPYPVKFKYWDGMSIFHKGELYNLVPNLYVVCFDTEKGRFRTIILPTRTKYYNTSRSCIGESRGQLYYTVSTPKKELQIYRLNDKRNDRTKWLPTHKIDTQFIYQHHLTPELRGNKHASELIPIAFNPDSEVIYLSIAGNFLSYHLSSEVLVEIFRTTVDGVIWAFPVIPCLESINPPEAHLLNYLLMAIDSL